LAKFYYGGQAVIEGVMMRGQRHMAVAVRAPNGEIVLHQEPLKGVLYRHPLMRLPVLRGFVALWDALGLGMKAIMFSADVAMQEETEGATGTGGPDVQQEATGAAATTPLPTGSTGTTVGTAPDKAFSGAAGWTSIALALAIMVSIFFVAPVLLAGFITNLTNTESNLAHNLIEGAIRLGFFIGYIWLIGRMRDIQRVFGYHGAEHKTINAYEAGAELTPERVQGFTLLNPRCGTTFLLIVLLLATALFIVIGDLPFPLMVLSRIVLVPLVAALSYEFIRLMANLYHFSIVRAIMAPGIALQKMTTRPPDLSMIEVGIAALQAVLVADGVLQHQAAERAEEPVSALA
jgi:uncharacterized protein YqhQ